MEMTSDLDMSNAGLTRQCMYLGQVRCYTSWVKVQDHRMTSSGVDAVDCKANANVKLGKQLRHGGW